MKRKIDASEDDPLDREVVLRNPRPNPYARDYYKSRNLRMLAPELLDVFPTSESVNEALRTLVRLNSAAQPQRLSAKTAAAPKTPRKKAGS
jgi:hypothetical protein